MYINRHHHARRGYRSRYD